MNKYRILFALLLFGLMQLSCNKRTELLRDNEQWDFVDAPYTNKANVKFIHAFSSLTPTVTSGIGPTLRIFMDGKQLSGPTSTLNRFEFTINGTAASNVFPVSVAYSVLPAGSHSFEFIMNRYSNSVFKPVAGDTVFRSSHNFETGKNYSIFLVDTVPTPNVIMKEDNWTVPSQGAYQLRMANLVANRNERVDVYSIRAQRVIFSNVGYKEITNYVELPTQPLSDSLIVRLAGTMTVRDTLKAFSPTSQRVYTLMSRGKTGVTGRTPTTTTYTNR
jgi:hypothetical protein